MVGIALADRSGEHGSNNAAGIWIAFGRGFNKKTSSGCREEEVWEAHSSYLSRPYRVGVSTCVAGSNRLLWLQRAQSLSHSR
jgi:hypothetical protein